ncbi:AzlC family ABC transporter permease [Veillonella sp. CHU732]|uniref:AzlC family ABC transporter permease n=1 Tax=Veillonella sp. CHU732 TaxID=2490949 RepID=UPI0019800F19|nr:AzlC family ABC transporter permease [Veillonella sp. CHU732]
METKRTTNTIWSAFRYGFLKITPLLLGFLFLGLSYGIYIHSMGFSWGYTLALSALIYAGSMEFVTVAMLLSPFDPVSAFLITLMVNGRHIFYGLSMLTVYRNTGWLKTYLIFGMTDESFSINYISQIPTEISKKWCYFL